VNNTGTKKGKHYEINGILNRKKQCAACLKNSVCIFVDKICIMGCLEGSGVPILHIGCTVPKS
jgi:hypothetical protein